MALRTPAGVVCSGRFPERVDRWSRASSGRARASESEPARRFPTAPMRGASHGSDWETHNDLDGRNSQRPRLAGLTTTPISGTHNDLDGWDSQRPRLVELTMAPIGERRVHGRRRSIVSMRCALLVKWGWRARQPGLRGVPRNETCPSNPSAARALRSARRAPCAAAGGSPRTQTRRAPPAPSSSSQLSDRTRARGRHRRSPQVRSRGSPSPQS